MNKFAINIYFALFTNHFFSLVVEASDECKEIASKSATLRLRRYLFCSDDWSERPNLDSMNHTTNVTMTIVPNLGNFDEYSSNLELYTWMYITWQDEHLTWDPSSFDDIKTLNVYRSEIWAPHIAVQSPGNNDASEDGLSPHGACEVHYDGNVDCGPRVRQTVRCKTDFTHWPYDRQNCTLVISSWIHTGRPIAFTHSKKSNRTVIMNYFVSNAEWKITVSRVFLEHLKSDYFENVTTPKLSIDFILDRIHGRLSGRYVTPGIIMMIMTLTTLWLDPRSKEGLAVACLNPIIHLLCIQDINWILPHNRGNTVPNIILFYINSCLMATLALVFALILAKLRCIEGPVPKWISSSTSSIVESKIGQIFLLTRLDPKESARIERDAEESDDLVVDNESKASSTWIQVIILLDWLAFLGFFFTYIVMWSVLVPNSSARTPISDIGLSSYNFLLCPWVMPVRYGIVTSRHLCSSYRRLVFTQSRSVDGRELVRQRPKEDQSILQIASYIETFNPIEIHPKPQDEQFRIFEGISTVTS